MPQQFRHLQYDERRQIQALHQQGFSVTAIAAQLQRNAGPSGYPYEQAQQLDRERRHRPAQAPATDLEPHL